MKITVIIEDTAGERDLSSEHGLSIYIETEKHRILADTGASPLTWENAEKLGIDLEGIDTVFLSHSHYDHSGGIMSFYKINNRARLFLRKSALGGYYHGEKYIGTDPDTASLPFLCFTGDSCVLDSEISFFSGIDGKRCRPESNLILSEMRDGRKIPDSFRHEQCLVIENGGKTVLVSGCAHNGILNILDRFSQLYSREPDIVISGFHMMKDEPYTAEDISVIEKTAAELSCMNTVFYTGHCTSEPAFDIMKPIMKDKLQKLYPGKNINIKP